MIDGDLLPGPISDLLPNAPTLPVMIGLTTLECGLLSELSRYNSD